MSVLFSNETCSLISHEQFVNKLYTQCSSIVVNPLGQKENSKHSHEHSYHIRSELFDLNEPYKRIVVSNINSNKRRKILEKKNQKEIVENPEIFQLIERLKCRTHKFIKNCHDANVLPSIGEIRLDIAKASNTALKLFLTEYQAEKPINIGTSNGKNTLSQPIVAEIGKKWFLIPANSEFINDCALNMDKMELAKAYDLIVLDPPWWNKYIRRSRQYNKDNSYNMQCNDLIKSIPIERLIHPNVTLVAIWCTNSPTLNQTLLEDFLPKWNLKLVATWYWIKITKFGETICEFNLPLKKQPFERIFIASHIDSDVAAFGDIENEKLIFSVPSAIQSHKPPLQDLLTPYIKNSHANNPKCLEIYARYLLPNCTSIGLEVLKLQNLQLYQKNN